MEYLTMNLYIRYILTLLYAGVAAASYDDFIASVVLQHKNINHHVVANTDFMTARAMHAQQEQLRKTADEIENLRRTQGRKLLKMVTDSQKVALLHEHKDVVHSIDRGLKQKVSALNTQIAELELRINAQDNSLRDLFYTRYARLS